MPRPKGYSPKKNNAENSVELNSEIVDAVHGDNNNIETPIPVAMVANPEKRVSELEKELEDLKSKIDKIVNTPIPTTTTVPVIDTEFGVSKGKVIPLSDKLSHPATFVMMGRGYVMSCYNHEGSEVRSPYGVPILFKWRNSDKRSVGGEDVAIHYSTYSTYSKKEVEFIKNSPYFGHIIFDSVMSLDKVNVKLVAAIEQATTYVANLTQDELFAIANTYKLDIDMSIKKLKDTIIAIKVQEISEQNDSINEKILSSSGLDHYIK